jgi:predicted component of type VI protein secretion system
MKAKLILVAGKADKGEVRLKLPTIIGRTRDAGLMIAHKTVSRRHCELFERHGMLYVRDSGSLNGTLVDDAPIKESMLKPGHTVTVGPLTFRAEYEPADAFLGGDEPDDAVNGVADTASGHTSAGEASRTAAMPTINGEFDPNSQDIAAALRSQNGAAEEVLDFGSEEPADDLAVDFGGDDGNLGRDDRFQQHRKPRGDAAARVGRV